MINNTIMSAQKMSVIMAASKVMYRGDNGLIRSRNYRGAFNTSQITGERRLRIIQNLLNQHRLKEGAIIESSDFRSAKYGTLLNTYMAVLRDYM